MIDSGARAQEEYLSVGGLQTTVRYLLDGKKSKFTVRTFASGILSSFGHDPTITIPDFEGEIVLNPEAIEQSSMRLVICAASLTDADDISEKDRIEINRAMHEDVLESNSFPEIVYQSFGLSASQMGEGQYWGTMNGELTLHGVRRSQAVPTRMAINEDEIKASGEFSVRLSDFNIRPVSAVGGMIKLKDELKFSFDISARKQE